ncbi:MAG TPA: tRNA uridine-5-carboxymethylaminomethyl(34) synthesis enzyme MnmG [Candidatus Fermentibacter daniensis]|nr:tRNA uridine-5-carboxymethylaminomethyl(34) synthesis enzyme MnmG [Candidatus Fermentibacter daniensis]
MKPCDVLVVGGGHAGAEAALAAVRCGAATTLVTMRIASIGALSCNPSIGGVAKGTLVKEIDALGGVIAEAADASAVQARMLNRSRGPAVWGPRVQCDLRSYAGYVRNALRESGVTLVEGEVVSFGWAGDRVERAILADGREIACRSAVIATGTFLGGMLYRGRERWSGGRTGDPAADALSKHLSERGFHVERFKTGTPPRLVAESIDFSAMEVQQEEGNDWRLSSRTTVETSRKRAVCFTTRAGRSVIEAARSGLAGSPMYSGAITGRGPRFCPSFEDKVVRFPERTQHPVFLEPVGLDCRIVYAGGMSTSLSRRRQIEMIRSLPGCSGAVVASWGYAVEYGYLPGGQIEENLRLKAADNLFVAGQACGTSGYEEAAGLGLVAGANAAAGARGSGSRFVPTAEEGYLGVMLRDVAGNDLQEPYRLYSSRAMNRLNLRQDNACRRMLPVSVRSGLARDGDEARLRSIEEGAGEISRALRTVRRNGVLLADLCRRTGFDVAGLAASEPSLSGQDPDLVFSVALDERYAGFVSRAERRARELDRLSEISLEGVTDYLGMEGLSRETREALQKARPSSLGEASRIPGMRPSDMEGLLVGVLRRVPRGTSR